MNLFIAGFRGTYRPTAPPNLGLEDNRPDVHDEADFDIPDTQAMLERFMSNMSKLADDEYQSLSDLLDSLPDPSSYTTAKTMTAAAARENGVIPEADAETLRAFSLSEMKLYKHATDHKWTVDELVKTIQLIKSADFKVEDVNVDLHKRVAAAIAQGKFNSHNHSCIDILVAQINDLTGRDIHIRYADKMVRRSRVFMDFLSMDGDEVSTATMCPTTQCASCWCPREQLQDSDHVFPFRDTQEIRAELETERAQLLNQDGTARDRCKDRVSF